jgi:hypothetical protein
MSLPLPEYQSLGSQIVNQLNKLSQNQLLNEQVHGAQIDNEFAPKLNQLKVQQGEQKSQMFPEEFKQQQLMNQLRGLELEQYKPKTEAETAWKNAQTNNLNILNKLPFAGRQLPGEAGKSIAIDMIKQQYGENSPQYMSAKNAYDLEQQKVKQTMEYQRSLMGSQNKRSATPIGKMFMEMDDIDKGFMPGTVDQNGNGIPIDEDMKKTLKDQYRGKMIKDITDSKTRERALFAKNMSKTINNLNPDDLTSYSGPRGRVELARDMALSGKGESVPRYEAYKDALTASNTLSKQVRQFYGDSITPSVQEGLKELTNPTSWFENPQVAKSRYNKFINILDTEADTFFDALKDPSIYEKPKKDNKSILSKYSDEDISHTAQKYGLTIDQVKQRLNK